MVEFDDRHVLGLDGHRHEDAAVARAIQRRVQIQSPGDPHHRTSLDGAASLSGQVATTNDLTDEETVDVHDLAEVAGCTRISDRKDKYGRIAGFYIQKCRVLAHDHEAGDRQGHSVIPSAAREDDATYKYVDSQVAIGDGFGVSEGDLQKTVGESLRRYRTDRGLSQEAFAELLGFHRTYIGGLERGERNLSLQSVERIASLLGVEPLALLVCSAPDDSERPSR